MKKSKKRRRVYIGRMGHPSFAGQVLVETWPSKKRKHLFNDGHHSPTGFAWGYSGSGPAQLARAILHDHLGIVPPPSMYQALKTDVIAGLPQGDNWQLSSDYIEEWIEAWCVENKVDRPQGSAA